MRDLVCMPIDQYRKDKRVMRGLQRGASSFSTSSALAVLDLANRLVYILQNTAQFAHDVVTPPSRNRYVTYVAQVPSSQPRDFREGVSTAYTGIKEGINEAKHVFHNTSARAENMSDKIGGVLRQFPSALLRPVILLTGATSHVLIGARNQIEPLKRQEDKELYKDKLKQETKH